jgi:hypothetical protein
VESSRGLFYCAVEAAAQRVLEKSQKSSLRIIGQLFDSRILHIKTFLSQMHRTFMYGAECSDSCVKDLVERMRKETAVAKISLKHLPLETE